MSLSLADPALRSYIAYSAILALKMLAVATLTSVVRKMRGAYHNPEDAKAFNGKVKVDAEVERVRRAHLNDLENIPAFWVLGALFVSTGPAAAWAALLFRTFTVCRVLHTLVYAVLPLPQPARAVVYLVSYAINVYMGLTVVLHYTSAL